MSHFQMLINYVPGEECRVALVEDGKLEELHVERFAAASRVGNIYLGRVNNVEASIQAAFVDFGVGENGFLHVSDLHPRYFPGGDEDETTEKVGHKTPRRERPPIQQCLRRGQEIVVQVLKEGVGTKGPTLTSYLSIPGRFLVMMPFMDKVGVSRKVEDEELRRQMRDILDQLELPDGFGFILRTAGMDRTKLELKRDLAYLVRLWKDMDRRLTSGSKPRLLYSESDLLVRALRDMLTNDIREIVIDNEGALTRAARFLKIVAPRSTCKLLHHADRTPLFHAFGVEPQIALMHAREVPLPSGGRLVIDQTEALVAIDVNSGKSREARDSEENAFQTNLEAVDEICRQLRLRDLGGIVVNDLIDMRSAKHRRDVETRFRERLKRDRAKSTTAPISPFGILELTRQRMRGSHETVHFHDCPICRGRGLVQKPDSVAADALRELNAVLAHDRVAKVEMVVAPRVAGELLSHKRQLLNRIERVLGKHVDVRVSEAVAIDRVTFYAYDAEGADLDLEKMPPPPKPRNLREFVYSQPDEGGDESWTGDPEAERALAQQEAESPEEHGETPGPHPIEFDEAGEVSLDISGDNMPGAEQGPRGKRRRRRGRGGQGGPGGGQSVGQGGGQGGQPERGRREGGRPEGGRPEQGGRDRGRHGQRPAQQRLQPRPVVSDDAEWGDEQVQTPSPRVPAEIVETTLDAESLAAEPIDNGEPMDGQQGQGGEGQPGTGRKRRRRRRRRGRGGGQQPGGEGAPVHADGEAPRQGEEPADSRPVEAGSGQAENAPEGPESGGQQRQGEPGTGGKRRRRRRGRGGRGRGGEGRGEGGGEAAGGAEGGAPRPQRAPRPAHSEGQSNRPPSEPKPAAERPPPPVVTTPQPKPVRSLYGAGRRKLNPSEINKRPKPE